MPKQVFVTSVLSSEMSEKISAFYNDDIEQISLGALKKIGVVATLRLMRSIPEMNVVLEVAESHVLSDIFKLLFFFSTAKTMHIVSKDLATVTLTRKDALWSFIKTGWGTLLGFYAALKSLVISKLCKNKYTTNTNETKKILYLKTNFWFGIKAGGSVAHVEGVISGFSKHGYSIDYAGIDSSPSLLKHIDNAVTLPLPQSLSIFHDTNLFIFDHLIYRFLLHRNYRHYDFIYHRMALNSFAAIRLAKKARLPLILEYNGSEVWVQRHWGKKLFLESISQSVEEACLRCADYIVTISSVLQQELIGRGISKDKIICYPNCVDPEKYNSNRYSAEILATTRQSLGFQQNDIVLTFVGTFGQWHGVDILAKIIVNLYEQHAQWLTKWQVKFLLVGDGVGMPLVKNILGSIPNYSDFVKLVGLIPQDEAPKCLALSDILLSPHAPAKPGEKFFGSPTKLFEYMSMKKVIIASDLDQIAEVLAPGVHIEAINTSNPDANAILCEPGNIAQFSAAIQYAVEHLNELQFMAENACNKVLQEYTWDRHVEVVLNAIRVQELEVSSCEAV